MQLFIMVELSGITVSEGLGMDHHVCQIHEKTS